MTFTIFQILVWHTKTLKVTAPSVKLDQNRDTNLLHLLDELTFKGIVKVSDQGDERELNVCRNASICS